MEPNKSEALLEKLGSKLESVMDELESKPLESILKVVIMYVVFRQLFKKGTV